MGNLLHLHQNPIESKQRTGEDEQSSNSNQRQTSMVQEEKPHKKSKKDHVPMSSYAEQVSHHIALTKYARNTLQTLSQEASDSMYQIPRLKSKIYRIKEQQSTYQGPFENRLPHGRGIVHFRDGSYYAGNFRQGQANGSGVYIYKNGSIYFGNFKNSVFEGFGTMRDQDKNIQYNGDWVNGFPEGCGEQIYFDNAYYRGDFIKGLKDGNGEYEWADGKTYIGEFRKNIIHGRGVLKDQNGQILYEGKFKNGMKSGAGVLHTKEGSYYGCFEEDFLEGKGIFVWKDRKVYVGQFKKTKFHGKGLILFENDQIADGIWQNNIKVSLNPDNYSSNNKQKFKIIKYELEIAQSIAENRYQGRNSLFESRLSRYSQSDRKMAHEQIQQSPKVSIKSQENSDRSKYREEAQFGVMPV